MSKGSKTVSTIGNRIKRYEKAYDLQLVPRSCLFIRVDGKSFHNFTKSCDKPFDYNLMDAMVTAAKFTAKQMSGFKLAYTQSDECTFMLTDFDTYQTEGWFNYELNKVVSISASAFTVAFNKAYGSTDAMFDSRAFVVPLDDASNVFIWRQRDWERNSIQMLARAHFSHKQCDRKKMPELHEMLHTKGINWAELDDAAKNGTFVHADGEPYSYKADYEMLKDYFTNELAEASE
jgi:tRNA(His) guanylyltransferase